MKLDPKISQPISVTVFSSALVLAMLNPARYMVLVGLWGVTSSIVCPLIVSVLPGCFFYYVLKEQDSENKTMKASGIAYCIFGMIVMPVLLTLSTKNLFSSQPTA